MKYLISILCAVFIVSCSTPPAQNTKAKAKPAKAQPAPVVAAPVQQPQAPAPAPQEIVKDLDSPLDKPAQPMNSDKADLTTLFYTIGKTYDITISVDRKISGQSELRFNGGSIRQLLNTLAEPNDLYLEERNGYLEVRRNKTEIFFLNYPQAMRTSSSTTSVTLNHSGNSSGTGNGQMLGQSMMTNNNGSSQNGAGGTGQSGSNDTNQLQIDLKNDDNFWNKVDTDFKAVLIKDEETVTVNRFSGLVVINAPCRRITEFWRGFVKKINDRNCAQVVVELKFMQFKSNDSNKIGFDWSQAQSTLWGSGNIISGATNNAITNMATRTLPQDTLLGNIHAGKLDLFVSALQEQGSVHELIKPTIRLMNNQVGFIKVGDDIPFFSVSSNLYQQTNSATSSNLLQDIYSQTTQTFGVVCPISAQISDDGYIILVLEPARTQYNGTISSPNGKQTAPQTGDARVNTMLRIRSGETAIVGGLLDNSNAKSKRGIPILGDVPALGRLFQTTAEVNDNSELLVAVTAQIVP